MLSVKMEGCSTTWSKRLSWHLLLLVLINACGNVLAERDGRCPALSQWGVCPSPLRKCTIDEECRGREKCCVSPCGKACVSPLFTGCEQLRAESLRRARALGGRFHVKVPTCDTNGAFEKIQCEDNVLETEDTPCWCVDASGFEIPATRAPSRNEVNCSNPKPCAGHTCRMLCPYGFELNPEDGCPICQCRDPCAGVTCPGSLTCQLEEAACLNQPCPPIPTCKRARSLDNLCPYGPPLKVEGERPFLCGTTPGKPQCPPLFQCLVQSGHDYGVCCSSSMQLEKQGACPAEEEVEGELYREEESGLDSQRRSICEGALCEYDLHCADGLKCCGRGKGCGKRCTVPQNMTICLQQRMLAQLLSSEAEREGRRGYVPQCSLSTGLFLRRQCSRNRLVCWCVDPTSGVKVHGSMGPAENVKCSPMSLKPSIPNNDLGSARSNGRSLCDTRVCAQLCEFGFKAIPRDGCPSCECDDNPCADFKCGPGEECITQRSTEGCLPRDSLCGSVRPICQPKKPTELSPSAKPINKGKIDDLEDELQSEFHDDTNDGSLDPIENRSSPTMCEYLRDFSSQMEASKDGMSLAVPIPTCNLTDGTYEPMQCEEIDGKKQCWCVDDFGTEIPRTRGDNNSAEDCVELRNTLDCLGLTCRLGCDFGFILDDGDPNGLTEQERLGNRCPKCECRDPCHGASLPGGRCGPNYDCLLAEVECHPGDYCPPVPSCVQKRPGQCPYLVPPGTGTCEYECRSDQHCNGTAKCCSNGCGTQCVQPLFLSACQHQKAVMEQRARESGIPARHVFLPKCQEPGGGFAPVQCHPVSQDCWCVNVGGMEIPGTRTTSGKHPNCPSGPFMPTKQSGSLELATDVAVPQADPDSELIQQDGPVRECPLYKCVENCPHGRLPDANGCPTCTCFDPCDQNVAGKGKIKCGEGEECRAIHVQCIDEPCPPVALCLPRASNPCVSSGGHPLLLVLPTAASPANASQTVTCGPDGDMCPSTHKCHLSPFGEYAVCCPKTKETCMGARDHGRKCYQPSSMRWRFNSLSKMCEQFLYEGCGGNLNNFDTEEACRLVCPAPTKCERARLRSEQLAQRLSKLTGNHAAAGVAATFVPRCISGSGAWEVVQCLDGASTPLCWCVDPISGTPVKGTISKRKLEVTECEKSLPAPTNLPRRRSGKAHNFESDWLSQEEDAVQPLDQLYLESRLEFEEVVISTVAPFLEEKVPSTESIPVESIQPLTRCQAMQKNGDAPIGDEHFAVKCDAEGKFLPMQCYHPTQTSSGEAYQECWCVDEAGNQLPNTTTFKRGTKLCLPTPIEAVEIHLGFHGNHVGMKKKAVIASIREMLNKMGAKIKADAIEVESRSSDSDGDTTHVQFSLIGPNKVDVAYQLEQMVKAKQVVIDVEMDKKSSKEKDSDTFDRKEDAIRKMVAEITSSYFSHRPVTSAGQRVIALEHREIFLTEGSDEDPAKESPLFGGRSINGGGSSSGAALLGVCAVSSFIICILSVLLMVQRSRSKSSGLDSTKKGVVVGDMEDGGSYYKTCEVVSSAPSSPAPIYVLTTDRIGENSKGVSGDLKMTKNHATGDIN